jgi:uncharacterized protein (DUF697 family)
MSQPLKEEAQVLIKEHVLFSMGVGAIPLPLLDIVAITAVQMDMIRQLCRTYEVDYHETRGKAVVTALSGTTLGRLFGYGIGSALKVIPGIGSLLGGVTLAVTAGASTYAIGQVFARHFQGGGSLFDLDPEKFKAFYKEQMERGKEVVRRWKEEREDETEKKPEADAAPKNPILEELKAAEQLWKSGALTEKEFEDIKDELLRRFMEQKRKKEE